MTLRGPGRPRLHFPGRFATLDRIERLDPATQYDEIAWLTSRYEFPWDFVKGTGIAFLRDHGVPSTAPAPVRPLVRRAVVAVMDEPLRRALGMPRQPAWFVAALRAGLRLRARALLFLPPRRTAYRHRPATYPHGYRLTDLGPLSMLDELSQKERTG